jgi:hypothetical protein
MKKVKLADVSKKKWNISKEDRQRLDSGESANISSRAMESIAKSMVTHIEISKDVRELAKAMMKAPAPVEVIVKADTTKKVFRFKIIRHPDKTMDYVDVEQL